MVYIVPRSAWRAVPPKQPITDPWTPWLGGVVIHHHGPGSGFPKANHQDCYQQVWDIQDETMNRSFFEKLAGKEEYDDIPYNYLVCQHGWVFEGRGARVRSAANGTETPGANKNYFAVMGMIVSGDQPSQAMVTSIRDLIGHLRQHENAGTEIKGHRNLFNTECPGNLYPYVLNRSFEPPPADPDPGSGVTIIPRSQWGARPPRNAEQVQLSSRTGFTVHYSAGPSTQTPRQIQNYHMDSQGWDDIGYNFLVDRNGQIYEGRGWSIQGAHATGYNTTHLGVCFIGRDGEATSRTAAAIRALYQYANRLCGRTLDKTWHGGLPGQSTECPGSALRAWVQGGMQGSDLPITDGTDGVGGAMTSVRTVAAQQRAVNGLGRTPPLTVDGIWGPLTEAGVRWLQTKVGVDADGLWGPQTEAAYKRFTGDTSAGGMTTVRSITYQQNAVNHLGRTPPLTVDGMWGPVTEAGVRWLQTKVGVDADGFWGPQTDAAYNGHVDEGARIVVDGDFGPATIAATQRAIGATVDGQWGPASIRALQNHLNTWSSAGLAIDGIMGASTVSAVQRHLNRMTGSGLTVDGLWGPTTVRALQNALNLGRF
ncbi:peptidoglycan-binding domain-containing protein [Micromonospora sp. NPDC048999]|uniref:peptidoglycan-binding domain-containing protein n=1 Tax=Micromonospora sp. NPDC048999 TaxID=3155391 RepID=UPI0033FB15AA